MNSLNKDIFHLDQTYKPLIRKICCQAINLLPNTPLEWEDLYWDFLYFFSQNKIFNPNKNITFATFLGLECKNFVRNKLKTFLSKKHSVLNNYISDERINFVSDFDVKLETEYVIKLKEKNFIESLEGIDSIVVNDHFINGESILSLSKSKNIGYKKLNGRRKLLKSKIINFVNN